MKYLIRLIAALIFLPQVLSAQETVFNITEVHRENEFYHEQMKLWKEVVEKEPKNETAWSNYYKAARYADFPAVFKDSLYRLSVDKVVEKMSKAIPNTFVYHHTASWHSQDRKVKFEHLQKAFDIDPSHPKVNEDLFTHHYVHAEWEKADEYMQNWYEKQTTAPQLIHYCFNILNSTEKDAVLFLFADNDSYPTWMLQTGQGLRTDVSAINLFILMDEDYARKALAHYNLKVDESAYNLLKPRAPAEQWPKVVEFFQHLAEKNPDRPLYFSLTIPGDLRAQLEDDLYIVGPV
ncbi:MAG: hypothetical protein AAF570_25835, partial [Bacteroidota bacterium]